ncbi:MAG: TIR domain-containing protein [Scytolyngbya sp. HA4215-MV1]|jgi:WD40 repeat protein|nr:TIR domain-containing protein [Scytolyngbya sp. HA4215-MV1]
MNQFQDAFISYGRADSKAFAKRLNDRLVAEGLEVWFDFDDIPLGVDYQNQIDAGIEQADNFLYIIAPHSVNSPYCGKEVELALRRNKRIIPILQVEQITQTTWQQRNPNGTDAEWEAYKARGAHSSFPNMHPEIAKINWIYCREGIDDFESAFAGLRAIMQRQQDYVHQHTVFLAGALAWERQQKQSRYLLVGEERQQAETWLKVRFKDEQPPCLPTDLHCEFITESIKNGQNLMTQVFLSYAEEEIDVMEKVRRSLRREGFTVWTNKTDIQTGVAFQEAINRGIEEADNIVYLLSPASLQSLYCRQEIEYALSLHKRIIPLLVKTTDLEQVPSALRDLQYIDLTDNVMEVDYQQDESQLIRILRQDAAYYEEHKMLLTKALKWERQHRNPSILLRGYNLQHAEAWLKVGKSRSQHPPLPIQEALIAASLQQPPGISLDVFVSYSRADSDFARRLNDALQIQGKTTWFDQESIASGSDFQQEIYHGIENSNHFLFVISPNAVQSPYCADEVEYAQKLNKRIITVLHRSVNPAELHPVLAAVQWIDFNQREGEFSANFKELLRTLDSDPVHLQAHTRLLVRAIEWDSRGRKDSFLLRGDDLEEAEQWMAQSSGKDPKPSSLQQDYVHSSRSVENATQQASQILQAAAAKGRQRVLIGTMVMAIGLVVAGIAGAYAYKADEQAKAADYQAKSAKEQAQIAKQQVVVAKDQISKAEIREKHAQTRLTQSAIAVKAAEHHKQLAQQQAQAAEQQLATASVKTLQAEQQLQQAHQKIALAQQSLTQAQKAQKEAQVGTFLEREGTDVLRTFQAQQLKALLSAVKTGKALKSLVKDGRPLEQYPAMSPVLALQTILNQILEQVQLHHAGGVTAATYSPNGKYIVTASDDRTAHLWTSSGQLIAELKESNPAENNAYTSEPAIVSFSSDNQHFVVRLANDNIVRVWNIAGQQTAELKGSQYMIRSVGFSPNGKRILTASPDDMAARIWDLSGHLITELKGHQSQVLSASFSPDGRRILTTTGDGFVQLWQESGQLLVEFKAHSDSIWSANFSPDGQHFVTASADATARVWDLSGRQIAELKGHQAGVTQASFSPDGKSIVTASDDKTARVWNLSGQLLAELRGHQARVTSISFSPDGQRIATSSDDTTARIWDLSGQLLAELRGHAYAVSNASFSPDGQHIVTASIDKTARVWDLSRLTSPKSAWTASASIFLSPNGQYFLTVPDDYSSARLWNLSGQRIAELAGGYIFAASFSADSKYLVTASNDATIQIWDRSGQPIAKFKGPQEQVTSISFSPNGKYIAMASYNTIAQVWDRSGKQIVELKGHQGAINGLSFSPDSQSLVTTSTDKTARVWDLSGRSLAILKGHRDLVWKARFSPNGRYIITAAFDKTARLWTVSGQLMAELKGHQDWVRTADFSPDSQRIVTTSDDGTAKIWDLSGRLVAELSGLGRASNNAVFSSDGQQVVVASSYYHNVQIWHAGNLDQLITQGCGWLGRYLQDSPELLEGDRSLCDGILSQRSSK